MTTKKFINIVIYFFFFSLNPFYSEIFGIEFIEKPIIKFKNLQEIIAYQESIKKHDEMYKKGNVKILIKNHTLQKCLIDEKAFYALKNTPLNKNNLFLSTLQESPNMDVIILPENFSHNKNQKLDWRPPGVLDIYNHKLFFVYFNSQSKFKKRFYYSILEYKIEDLIGKHLNKNDKRFYKVIDYATFFKNAPILNALYCNKIPKKKFERIQTFFDISITKYGIYSFVICNTNLYIATLKNKKWIYEHVIPIKFNAPFYAAVFKNNKYVVTADYKVYKVNKNTLNLVANISTKNKYCIIDKIGERLFFAPIIPKKYNAHYKLEMIKNNKIEEFIPNKLTIQSIGNINFDSENKTTK